MRAEDEREFRDFVTVRLEPLRRSAYLLCGDVHRADDLVSITVGKLFRSWRKIRRLEQPDAYLRRILVNAWLDERRRPCHREVSSPTVPEPPPRPERDVDDRVALVTALLKLPARRRAVLVLRFLDDLSVEQTAQILGCTAGTVKSTTARGLTDLRALLGVEIGDFTSPTREGRS